jgi:hypothetical protein
VTTNCISASIARAEWVRVIDDQANDRRILRVDAAGVLRGDDDGGVDLAGAHVFASLHLVGVIDGGEGLDVDGDGVEGLADSDGLRAVVVVDHGDARSRRSSRRRHCP